MGLWLHKTKSISFTLVVDDFGVCYEDRTDCEELIKLLEETYPCKCDWSGNRYIGVNLDWDYKKRELRTSMPGYVKKALVQFQHIKEGGRKQHSPSPYEAPDYGKKCQMTNIDLTPTMTKEDKSGLQKTTGKFLYYGRAVDDTMLHALNCLSTRVNDGTERTKAALKHFLDYCHDNPDAVKLYVASDMILFIDSDASYLVKPMAKKSSRRILLPGKQKRRHCQWINSNPSKGHQVRYVISSRSRTGSTLHECETSSSNPTSTN